MAMFTLSKLCHLAVKLGFWISAIMVITRVLALLLFVIPPCVYDIVVNTSYGFKKANFGEHVYGPSWKESFDYEVKVYASTRKTLPKYQSQFFENIQLLWHIPPQRLDSRYPTFKHTASLEIPRSVIRDKSFKKQVYAHVFIQRSDQFTPHPNTNYRHGVYSVYQLAWWVDPKETRGWAGNSTANVPMELMTATSIPWAILLEDYGYTDLFQIPGYLLSHLQLIAETLPDDATVPPPFQINSYTRNPHDFMPKVLLRSNETVDTFKDMTIDIDMEISGIHRFWVIMKDHLLKYLGNDYGYQHTTLGLPDLVAVNPDDYVLKYRKDADTHLPLTLVERFGLPRLIIGNLLDSVYGILRLLHIHSGIRLWSSNPLSSTCLSSQMALLYLVRYFVHFLRRCLVPSTSSLLAITGICAVCATDILFSSNDSNAGQNVNEAVTDIPADAANHSPPEQTEPNSSSGTSYRWDKELYLQICKPATPFLVVLAAYTYYQTGGRIFGREFALRYIASSIAIIEIILWLPQVVLNHQIRFVMPNLAQYSAIVLAMYIASGAIANILPGHNKHKDFSVFASATYICNVLVILQWCWYKYN